MVYRVLSLLLGRTWPTCCGQIPWARAAVLGVEAPPIRSCVARKLSSSPTAAGTGVALASDVPVDLSRPPPGAHGMAYIEFVVTARKATGSSPANRGPSAPPTLPQDDAQPASGQPLAGCSFMVRNRSTGELAGPALGNARAPEHRRVPLSVGGVEASATSRPAGENPRTERLAERSPALVSWPCQALRRDIAHSNAPQGPGARPTVAEFRRMHAPARSRTVGANAPIWTRRIWLRNALHHGGPSQRSFFFEQTNSAANEGRFHEHLEHAACWMSPGSASLAGARRANAAQLARDAH